MLDRNFLIGQYFALVLFTFNCVQVQLLVSNEDVDNYKQIKSDLDRLRILVEKSELWVYKGRSPSPIPTKIKKRQSKITGDEAPKVEPIPALVSGERILLN